MSNSSEMRHAVSDMLDTIKADDQVVVRGSDDESLDYDLTPTQIGLQLCQNLSYLSGDECALNSGEFADHNEKTVDKAFNLVLKHDFDDKSNSSYESAVDAQDIETIIASLEDKSSTRAKTRKRKSNSRKRKHDTSDDGLPIKRGKKEKKEKNGTESDASRDWKPVVDESLFGQFGQIGDQEVETSEYEKEYALQCKTWFQRQTRSKTD